MDVFLLVILLGIWTCIGFLYNDARKNERRYTRIIELLEEIAKKE